MRDRLFTPAARKALTLSRQEAQRDFSTVIDTQHLLRGILQLQKNEGLGIQALHRPNVDLQRIRTELDRIVAPGADSRDPLAQPPYSAASTRAIEIADDLGRQNGQETISTASLLLALFRITDGNALRALNALKVTEQDVRKVLEELSERESS